MLCLWSAVSYASTDTKKDIPIIIQNLNIVLDNYAKGVVLIWQNHGTGHYGEVMPTSDTLTGCRQYKRTWVFDQGVDIYAGKACKKANGVWAIASEKKQRREALTDQNDPLKIASRKAAADKKARELKVLREAQRKQTKAKAKIAAAQAAKQAAKQAEAQRIETQRQAKEKLKFEAEQQRLAAKQQQALQALENQRLSKQATLEKAQADAQRLAIEKQRLKLQSERLKQLELKRIDKLENERLEKMKLLGLAIAGVIFLVGLLGSVISFFRSTYWQERKQLKNLLSNHSSAKALFHCIKDAQTIKPRQGYEALTYLCFAEEQLEELISALPTQHLQPDQDFVGCLKLCKDAHQSIEQYKLAVSQLGKHPLCKVWGITKPYRSWCKACSEKANQSLSRLERCLTPIKLSAEIAKLKPELGRRDQILNTLPLDTHLDIMVERREELAKFDQAASDGYGKLFSALKGSIKKTNLPPINDLADIPDDLARINQIKSIIDLYNKKIIATHNDSSLTAEDQEESEEYLKRLRERDIAMLEGES